jgi:2-oxoglutarate dehydrogenase E1 component
MPPNQRTPSPESLAFVESLYADYLRSAESVPEEWRRVFEAWRGEERALFRTAPSFTRAGLFRAAPSFTQAGPFRAGVEARGPNGNGAGLGSLEIAVRQDKVDALVRAYRVRGHMVARIDPLGLPRREQPELEPSFYGLGEADMDLPFSTRTISGQKVLTLREILARLRNTYCRSIGVQFMHIDDLRVKEWLQFRMEGSENRGELSRDEQLRILVKLTDAVMFEEFVQRKYLGAKSFSLEGSESLIPLLAFAIEYAAADGVDEIVLGMPHRGRLNVLANILGKNPRDIFREFEDRDPELYIGSGDVKYHLGHSSDYLTAGGRPVHLSLCFNPSHLEFVNPVVLGRTRAKQLRKRDASRQHTLALLLHGDAAFAGEGVVQETLNLSQIAGYTVGGTIHIITNNQIGFTTSPPEARSSVYATDVAKMLQIPIFHVNGEDPEAVAQVVRLAIDFRATFFRDVVIDMYGYRRHGHNEGDEPSFTQPLLYAAIARRQSVRDGYLEHLLKLGGVTQEEADSIAVERREQLERELGEARSESYVRVPDWLGGAWQGYLGGPEAAAPEVDTSLDREVVCRNLRQQCELPDGFRPHPKIERLLSLRREMADGERALDWGAAEVLAFGSLLEQGVPVRLTGQDCERGTFSQRHAVLHDIETGARCFPLGEIARGKSWVEMHNSPLCEAGALGFEYGFSLDMPDALVVWEAQFGDFANVAQVIIDQFIVSAEDKWRRLSGIVLLLPHGFEGQGPEHSSARLERFLVLAAEENIQIVQPSTPAQHYHCLRRQALRRWRKPLVVLTPKSLLRHPKATSTIDECAHGQFQRVIVDRGRKKKTERVLLCSGKVYYDLARHRDELDRGDVAIVRIEQFYPLPEHHLRAALDPYDDGTPVVWVQEEPENMGAWRHLRARFGYMLFSRFPFTGVCRAESASPATGSASSHRIEQHEIIARAFEGSGWGSGDG